MKKLCIVFPGRKYSCDRSLLYYPSKLLENRGYEMIYLHYNMNREDDDNRSIDEFISDSEKLFRERIKDIDLSKYDKIIFISKSVGTVLAGRITKELPQEKVFNVFITPIDQTLEYIRKVDLIICGDRDQYFKDAKNKLARFSYAYLFPYSSHSLESKNNYDKTTKTINDVTSIIHVYFDSIYA